MYIDNSESDGKTRIVYSKYLRCNQLGEAGQLFEILKGVHYVSLSPFKKCIFIFAFCIIIVVIYKVYQPLYRNFAM